MTMSQPSAVTSSVTSSATSSNTSTGNAEASATTSLASLVKGNRARIQALTPARSAEQTLLLERLKELGFVPGELLRVVAIAFPSADPIAVRIVNTTFALRRHEAELIQVEQL